MASPYDQDKFVPVRVPWDLTGRDMASAAMMARAALEVAKGEVAFVKYSPLSPVSMFGIEILAACTMADESTPRDLRERVIGLTLAARYLYHEVEPALRDKHPLLCNVLRAVAAELYQKGGHHALLFISERLSASGYAYQPKRASQIAKFFDEQLVQLSGGKGGEAAAVDEKKKGEDEKKEEKEEGEEETVAKKDVTVTLEPGATPMPETPAVLPSAVTVTPASPPEVKSAVALVPAVPTAVVEVAEKKDDHAPACCCEDSCPISLDVTPAERPHPQQQQQPPHQTTEAAESNVASLDEA